MFEMINIFIIQTVHNMYIKKIKAYSKNRHILDITYCTSEDNGQKKAQNNRELFLQWQINIAGKSVTCSKGLIQLHFKPTK